MLFSKFICSFHIISYIINFVCLFTFIFEFEQDGRRTSKHQQPSSPHEVEKVLNKINQLQKKMADRKSLKFNASEMGGINQSIWPFNLGAYFYVQELRNTDVFLLLFFWAGAEAITHVPDVEQNNNVGGDGSVDLNKSSSSTSAIHIS